MHQAPAGHGDRQRPGEGQRHPGPPDPQPAGDPDAPNHRGVDWILFSGGLGSAPYVRAELEGGLATEQRVLARGYKGDGF
jgi:hypothetical protein